MEKVEVDGCVFGSWEEITGSIAAPESYAAPLFPATADSARHEFEHTYLEVRLASFDSTIATKSAECEYDADGPTSTSTPSVKPSTTQTGASYALPTTTWQPRKYLLELRHAQGVPLSRRAAACAALNRTPRYLCAFGASPILLQVAFLSRIVATTARYSSAADRCTRRVLKAAREHQN